ncbi:MAG: hypothetical protein ACYC6Y_22435, partial [Thermoguttaceae bacterium]
EAGAAASDRSPDEVGSGMAVLRGADGTVLWEKPQFAYAGPCILHGDTIITNSVGYKQSQGALSLVDGSPVTIEDPVTGQPFAWKYARTYGCNTAVASEYLLTFRSGSAGFYDLFRHGGTGNFGGFKSGCTSNLIIANGVLNAPDYTRTCTCGYQNQASLAMVPMPENELWSYNLFAQPERGMPDVRRVGVNFGAPGDRVAEDGTLWVNFPADAGTSPKLLVEAQGEPKWYRNHAARIVDGPLAWVAASGSEGPVQFTVRLAPSLVDPKMVLPVGDPADDAEEAADGAVDLTSSDLELTRDKSRQVVGLRFTKVPLATADQIGRAYLQFETDETTDEPTELEIHGQAVDDAPAFKAEKGNISSRALTEAAIAWHPEAWEVASVAGPEQQTPDLTALLREITARPGWKENGALALIVRGSGKRVASAADGGSEGAAKLVVEIKDGHGGDDPPPRAYTVRMVFAEPDTAVKPGDRVFDVVLQGREVESGMDVVARAAGPMKSIVVAWKDVLVTDALRVELRTKSPFPPIVSGVEILRQD